MYIRLLIRINEYSHVCVQCGNRRLSIFRIYKSRILKIYVPMRVPSYGRTKVYTEYR